MAANQKNQAEAAVDPVLKKALFELTLISPGNWYLDAVELRAAADRLDYIKHPARDDEETISHGSAYQMLLSFSFENLLKGLIIYFRMREGLETTLLPAHYTHDLKRLATDPACDPLSFSLDELATLDRLSPFGIWAGRYPMPKLEREVIAKTYGGHHYAAELVLWERLAKFLKERAWITKWSIDPPKQILMLCHPSTDEPSF